MESIVQKMLIKPVYLIIFICTFINCQQLYLKQGEICSGSGITASKCELLKNCPQIGDFKRKRPKICTFQGVDPIICCPPPAVKAEITQVSKLNITTNGNAKKHCLGNTMISCLSPMRVRRNTFFKVVVGGKEAKPKEHKGMVLIGYGPAGSKSWNCGGSLISDNWVLSAAHCSSHKGLGVAKWARVGDLDISSTDEVARPQEKMIIDRIVHPLYKEPNVYNDIALFKLDSNVEFNSYVAPYCLQTEEEITATKATVTGWGRLHFVGAVSEKLQEVEISLVNGSDCKRLHGSSERISRGVDTESMICAGEREGGKDACSGDSGGPLALKEQSEELCLKTQIGITSFGIDCGLPNTPGVYTRVSYYVPWIESIVWPGN